MCIRHAPLSRRVSHIPLVIITLTTLLPGTAGSSECAAGADPPPPLTLGRQVF